MKSFNCTCCGDCCSGDMNIFINIYDLYKMGKHLELNNTSELFLKNYVELELGQNGLQIPKLKFKTKPYKFCPFLINDVDDNFNLKGFCSLHPYIKPLVCILAPTHREYDSITKKSSYGIIKPTESCPGTFNRDNIKLEEFLEPVKKDIGYEDKFYDILTHILDNNITDYSEILYNFNLKASFSEILSSICLLLGVKGSDNIQ